MFKVHQIVYLLTLFLTINIEPSGFVLDNPNNLRSDAPKFCDPFKYVQPAVCAWYHDKKNPDGKILVCALHTTSVPDSYVVQEQEYRRNPNIESNASPIITKLDHTQEFPVTMSNYSSTHKHQECSVLHDVQNRVGSDSWCKLQWHTLSAYVTPNLHAADQLLLALNISVSTKTTPAVSANTTPAGSGDNMMMNINRK